jgi:hypothetical protein
MFFEQCFSNNVFQTMFFEHFFDNVFRTMFFEHFFRTMFFEQCLDEFRFQLLRLSDAETADKKIDPPTYLHMQNI